MATKIDDIMQMIAAQNAQISALAAAVAGVKTGATEETRGAAQNARAGRQRTADQNANSASAPTATTADVTGTVTKIAVHQMGIQMAEHVDSNGARLWFNAVTPLFTDISVGQRVTLTMGSVRIPEYVAKKGANAGKAIAAHNATRVVAVSTVTRTAPKATTRQSAPPAATVPQNDDAALCPYCGNGCPVSKYDAIDIVMRCARRQFVTATNGKSASYLLTWIAENAPVRAFAKNASGFEDLGIGAPAPPTTTSDDDQPKRGRGRPKGSKNAPKAPVEPPVVTPDETDDMDDEIQETAPVKPVLYAPTDGEFVALVVKTKRTNTGRILLRVIGDGALAGPKNAGIEIGARPDSAKIGPAILKLNANDRVSFTLSKGYIVKLKRIEIAASTANVTSGRNEAPLPKPQPSNGGAAGRRAQLRKRGAATVFNCSKTNQHRNTCKGSC